MAKKTTTRTELTQILTNAQKVKEWGDNTYLFRYEEEGKQYEYVCKEEERAQFIKDYTKGVDSVGSSYSPKRDTMARNSSNARQSLLAWWWEHLYLYRDVVALAEELAPLYAERDRLDEVLRTRFAYVYSYDKANAEKDKYQAKRAKVTKQIKDKEAKGLNGETLPASAGYLLEILPPNYKERAERLDVETLKGQHITTAEEIAAASVLVRSELPTVETVDELHEVETVPTNQDTTEEPQATEDTTEGAQVATAEDVAKVHALPIVKSPEEGDAVFYLSSTEIDDKRQKYYGVITRIVWYNEAPFIEIKNTDGVKEWALEIIDNYGPLATLDTMPTNQDTTEATQSHTEGDELPALDNITTEEPQATEDTTEGAQVATAEDVDELPTLDELATLDALPIMPAELVALIAEEVATTEDTTEGAPLVIMDYMTEDTTEATQSHTGGDELPTLDNTTTEDTTEPQRAQNAPFFVTWFKHIAAAVILALLVVLPTVQITTAQSHTETTEGAQVATLDNITTEDTTEPHTAINKTVDHCEPLATLDALDELTTEATAEDVDGLPTADDMAPRAHRPQADPDLYVYKTAQDEPAEVVPTVDAPQHNTTSSAPTLDAAQLAPASVAPAVVITWHPLTL